MYLVARNIKEVLTNPIGLTRNSIAARDLLNAPCHVVPVLLTDKRICETPFRCETREQAEELKESVINWLKEVQTSQGRNYSHQCYEPQITTYLDGHSRVTLQIYVIKRELPIGRNLKEAYQDPLGTWDLRKSNPIFEEQTLKLSSGVLRSRFKTLTKLENKFSAEIAQGIIKPIQRNSVYRPKFRFLKAPRYTFNRDIRRMKAQSEAPLNRKSLLIPDESEDLFNRNIRLVESEGSGRSMGL